jgi:hypothetical protein
VQRHDAACCIERGARAMSGNQTVAADEPGSPLGGVDAVHAALLPP